MSPSVSRSKRRRQLERLEAPSDLSGDVFLDTVGLYCPVPIIRTSERVRSMPAGSILEVLSDDRVILTDMPAWCLSTGHTYLGYRDEEVQWRLFVKKK